MSSKLQHPCPQAYVTQRFSTSHPGLDLAKGPGTPILAAHDGVVTVASWDTQGYGNRIDLTGSEVMTRYGHLRGFACQVGEQVCAGHEIVIRHRGDRDACWAELVCRGAGRTDRGGAKNPFLLQLLEQLAREAGAVTGGDAQHRAGLTQVKV